MLVVISLVFEVFAVDFCHRLPGAADLLHDLESAHVRVVRDNLRTRLLDENHVRGEALFWLFYRLTLLLKLLEFTLIPFLV